MKKIVLLTFSLFLLFSGYSQCTPDPTVMALGDPDDDGVLNPWYLEVSPGETFDLTVTVLAPPGGTGDVNGFNVPYTMNFFTVKNLDNMPSWVSYQCPNNCKYLAGVYSCVQVSGTAPSNVVVGDSTVMEVIVDANVDATVLGFPINGYEVTNTSGGTLTIRYVDTKGIKNELDDVTVKYDINSDNIILSNLPSNTQISVYNMLGNKVVSTSSTDYIKMNSFPKGIYVVDISSEKGRKTLRLVKY